MNAATLAWLVCGTVLLLALPRRRAVFPVVLTVLYTTRAPVLELGPANLSVLRVLIAIGILRVCVRREALANGVHNLDRLVFGWGILLVAMSAFHSPDAWVFRSGLVWGELGFYLLCRIFIRDLEDVRRVFAFTCVALMPLALLMLLEKFTAQNYFTMMGTAGPVSIRQGHIRACGPFAHAILAGNVGATCLPMALSLWRTDRLRALIGALSAAGIVVASTSSTPVMMVAFGCLGLLFWIARGHLSLIRWGTVAALCALQLVMQDPVYFLMARIDVTGGSTGWHRSQLIRSAIEHWGEWWAAGTDYTRHWMPTGIPADQIHADLTNHYLQIAVWGGLPLLLLFILLQVSAFRLVGRAWSEREGRTPQQAFLIWTLGAILFAYAMNFWASSPFDQSISFMYLVLAMIAAVKARTGVTRVEIVPSRVQARFTGGDVLRPHVPPAWAGGAPRVPGTGFTPRTNWHSTPSRERRSRGRGWATRDSR